VKKFELSWSLPKEKDIYVLLSTDEDGKTAKYSKSYRDLMKAKDINDEILFYIEYDQSK